ncbi:MAG: phosphatidate cytidylyltransferase [Pseudomonadota bacterium]|nr:phosphatidate cytidylyltransferase [Pseudomonadota bacterium]
MLKQRIITALILLPLVLGAIFYLPTPWFALAMVIPVTVAAWEWANIMGLEEQPARFGYAALVVVGLALEYWIELDLVLALAVIWWSLAVALVRAYPAKVSLWSSRAVQGAIGLVLLLPAWWGLLVLHRQEGGSWWLLYAFLLVWGADTGAYFAGRAFGKHKLAPAVSPGKTIEGLLGGLAVTALIAILVATQTQALSTVSLAWFLLVSLVAVLGSVFGDLAESMFKRHRGIKDSSQILPGHGGILDRIDSITAAVPLFSAGMLLLGAFK